MDSLHDDMIYHVSIFLDVVDVGRMEITCKNNYRILRETERSRMIELEVAIDKLDNETRLAHANVAKFMKFDVEVRTDNEYDESVEFNTIDSVNRFLAYSSFSASQKLFCDASKVRKLNCSRYWSEVYDRILEFQFPDLKTPVPRSESMKKIEFYSSLANGFNIEFGDDVNPKKRHRTESHQNRGSFTWINTGKYAKLSTRPTRFYQDEREPLTEYKMTRYEPEEEESEEWTVFVVSEAFERLKKSAIEIIDLTVD